MTDHMLVKYAALLEGHPAAGTTVDLVGWVYVFFGLALIGACIRFQNRRRSY